jgi:toxin ParE1/3/4
MAYRIEFTGRARSDLRRIYGYIGAAQSDPAFAWFLGLQTAIRKLADAPRSGPVTHEDPGIRHLIYGNKPHFYRVIYQVDDTLQSISIISIRHGRRQPFK